MEKRGVVLMDLTQYQPDPELERTLAMRCHVHRTSADHIMETGKGSSSLAPVALCAEFDYPDITRLAVLSAVKRRHPRLPILMFTEQHSEALAVWALRARIWNYFVKPVDRDLVLESLDLLIKGAGSPAPTPEHTMLLPSVSLPKENRFRDANEERRATLRAAEDYVGAHLSERISVGHVAAACGLGTAQFTRDFKQIFRTTFSAYLLKRRIQLACQLLRNRSASVNDIGWTVGLRDPSHFTRTFRNQVGVSPSEYRALWQQQHGFKARRDVTVALAPAPRKSAKDTANFS